LETEPGRLQGGEAYVWCVAFTPDGKQAVSGHGDGFLRLWDLAGGKEVRRFAGHWGPVRALAMLPDGKRLLSGSPGSGLIVWDLASGRELHRFATARDTAGISIAPDSQTALTASLDTYMYLWDLSEDTARARDLARLGKLDEAEAAYDRAIERRPQDLDLRLDRARLNARRRQWDKAIADYDAVLAVRASQPDPWMERGRCCAEAGRWDQVAAAFIHALDLVPVDLGLFSQRNQIAFELAQWGEALARAAEMRPKDGMLWIARGRYLARRDRWKEAAEAYARVIATRPIAGNEERFECACLLLLNHDETGYLQLCKELITRAGKVKDPFLAYVLARTCGQAPGAADPAQVIQWAEQAVANVQNGWYLHALGLALYRAGRFAEAIERLEASNRTNWAATLANWPVLAMAHHRLGHGEDARRWLDSTTAEMKRLREAHPNGPVETASTDWLETEVLRREAEAVLGGGPARR
jgi:tetratricopeptide (TPR) repeat protein